MACMQKVDISGLNGNRTAHIYVPKGLNAALQQGTQFGHGPLPRIASAFPATFHSSIAGKSLF